ncbi:calmodulin-binding transcription activator (camta), plants, putative [Ricinus communis]|uniref:Calmodulin-binding transcription activator (Camta), plants, putative n=1 Tax=Ricinus communis TaxID=3988 RepID=B9RMC9_RICCO|nr:calmodulin-binding transcription activator (camta), plants, putative [Ricinus communis]
MSQSGYDINALFQEAQMRWLKPAEVQFILQNHEKYQLNQEPPQKPTKLHGIHPKYAMSCMVGNVEALNCYYAHGEQNPNFQRRSYWMLDPAYEHIVLVHYREISEGKSTPGSAAQLSPSSFSPSPSSYTTQNQDSTSIFSDSHDPYHNSSSPGSVEVSSGIVIQDDGLISIEELTSSRENENSQFFRRLEEQLSLNEDSINDVPLDYNQEGAVEDLELLAYEGQFSKKSLSSNLLPGSEYIANNQGYGGHARMQLQTNSLVHHEDADGSKESISWNDVLEFQVKHIASCHIYDFLVTIFLATNTSTLLTQEVENFDIPAYSSISETYDTNPEYYSVLYDQGQLEVPIEADSSLTVAQQQKFRICEISPEWGYNTEVTKVIIIGSFLCDPSESAWTCMFGNIEVPVEIIQEGVLRCEAPPHLPGKVTFCITIGNRESCSEIREFEYRSKNGSCAHCNSQMEVAKSPEELLLLVRFVQMLLSDSSLLKEDSIETGIDLLRKLKTDDDSWGSVIEALLVGNGTSSGTVDWLLQQLLKDKLQQWFSSKSQDIQNRPSCPLSKKEQGIIHMVAGLGFEWALSPILSHGVSIDFRDINGWTALHWAARFGREKMVAALLASGASAGAVTDPTSQDPIGKTPASIAANNGYKGLAGYLSELALTSHLSSLTLEESELSKGSAQVEAERTVDSIAKGSFAANEDQVSLKDTLAAVRNAAQAAARIQSAFRAHSFRKRQEKEAAVSANCIDEYGVNIGDIQGLSAVSKLAFRNARDYNSAALSIQKKYRGWKGRKDFLAFRQKVVKIQAHVRGYQVRKHYKVICWAVGILDKVVLRWRRKGVGLRGFRNETEHVDESEDEDILKVFRKQKVDGAIDEAVSRVLSMVDSPDARQQYHRMLERYRLAKAELGETSEAVGSGSAANMENDNIYYLE